MDSYGNIFITGNTGGNLDGQTNAGDDDIFVAKYDASGNKKWTKILGTSWPDIGNAIAIDSSDNIYVTGTTYAQLFSGQLPRSDDECLSGRSLI